MVCICLWNVRSSSIHEIWNLHQVGRCCCLCTLEPCLGLAGGPKLSKTFKSFLLFSVELVEFRSFEVSKFPTLKSASKCFSSMFLFHVFSHFFAVVFDVTWSCQDAWLHQRHPNLVVTWWCLRDPWWCMWWWFLCVCDYIYCIYIYIYIMYICIYDYIYIYIFIWSWTLNPLNLLTLVVWHTLLWFPPCNPCGP